MHMQSSQPLLPWEVVLPTLKVSKFHMFISHVVRSKSGKNAGAPYDFWAKKKHIVVSLKTCKT